MSSFEVGFQLVKNSLVGEGVPKAWVIWINRLSNSVQGRLIAHECDRGANYKTASVSLILLLLTPLPHPTQKAFRSVFYDFTVFSCLGKWSYCGLTKLSLLWIAKWLVAYIVKIQSHFSVEWVKVQTWARIVSFSPLKICYSTLNDLCAS